MSIDWGKVESDGEMKASGFPEKRSRRRTSRHDTGSNLSSRRSRPEHSPIKIVKAVDAASPTLRQAHKRGKRLRRVVITGRDPSGKSVELTLKYVELSSYEVTGSGTEAKPLTEEISLVFRYFDVDYPASKK